MKRILLVATLISAAFVAAYLLSPQRDQKPVRAEPVPAAETVSESRPKAHAPDTAEASAEQTAATVVDVASPAGSVSEDPADSDHDIADDADARNAYAANGYEVRICTGHYILASVESGIQRAVVNIRSSVPIYLTLKADMPAEVEFTQGVAGFDKVSSPELGLDEDLSASAQVVSLAPLAEGGYPLYSGSRWIGSVTVRK